MGGKTCTKCGEWKAINQYHNFSTQKKCKDCRLSREPRKTKQNYKNKGITSHENYNRKKSNKFNKKSKIEKREKDGVVVEGQKCIDCKEWKPVNQYYKRGVDGLRDSCKECEKVYKKIYEKSEKGRESRYRRTIKRRSYNHKVKFTPHERKQILDRDKWICQCCEIKVHDDVNRPFTPDKANVDHYIAISKKGDSTPYNLQVLCRACNGTKGNKVITNDELYFLRFGEEKTNKENKQLSLF